MWQVAQAEPVLSGPLSGVTRGGSRKGKRRKKSPFFFFEFQNFIYFFIQQVLISYPFYTYQCIYVIPNLPIHHTHTHTHTPATFPPWCPYVYSLHLCLYFCPSGNKSLKINQPDPKPLFEQQSNGFAEFNHYCNSSRAMNRHKLLNNFCQQKAISATI